MRCPRSALEDLSLPADEVQADTPATVLTWCVFFVSVTAILLGSFVGSIGAFAFLGIWIAFGLAYGRAALRCFGDGPRALWILPFFAMASTCWSQSPPDTLKFGLEYVATAGCAVLAASLLRPRALMSSLTCCLVMIAFASVLLGKQSVDPLTGSSAFVGIFESKNQLGFFTSLMLLASVALLMDAGQARPIRVLGLLAMLLALPLLVLTRSGTALLSAVLACVVLVVNLMLSRLSRRERARLLLAAVVVLMPVVALVLIAGDDAGALLLSVMGKDATLTGRTLLWQRALELIPHHPLFGHGYQAFWRQDTVEAESLWHDFHVLSRQGFHFHSTYVEAAVELGYVGAGILVATLLGAVGGLLRWSWRTGTVPASFFTALMFCMMTRSFVEVDVLLQFQIGTFVLFVAATYGARRPPPGRT